MPECWGVLFNSYYEAGRPSPSQAPSEVCCSRPSIAEVMQWRERVDQELKSWLLEGMTHEQAQLLELGLQHEQQHQELLLMDLLDGFSRNPLAPSYDTMPNTAGSGAQRPVAGTREWPDQHWR